MAGNQNGPRRATAAGEGSQPVPADVGAHRPATDAQDPFRLALREQLRRELWPLERALERMIEQQKGLDR